MTLEEKFSMMAGVKGKYVGNTKAIDRLGIPELRLQDGPQGFRATDRAGGEGSSTAWPSTMTIAASWDADLVYRWALSMGKEFKDKGANVHLGPGLGIARVPTAGRTFEYLCGEDPILGAKLVPGLVRGIQENGIIANAKHFTNNEIEDHRMLVSANVDERTRFELYYPPFEAANKAGVLSVMCAYNRINDVYACQNNDTLSHLRNDLGFEGWVVSDWTATKSTSTSLHAGLDQEMPLGLFYSDHALNKALDSSDIALSEIDTSVTRILYAMYSIGLFDHGYTGDVTANVTSVEHSALAREIAAKSSVLLKNSDNTLPLNANELGSCIAVFGDDSTISGGGSGHVNPAYIVTPAAGIQAVLNEAGSSTQVLYNDGKDITAATQLASSCDTSVIVVATTSSEGSDRDNLSLGDDQNNLVSAIAAVSKRAIVAVNAPGAVLLPFSNEVKGLFINWLPGQEFGNALADVLFGKVNPSARLPLTLPNKENEIEFNKREYPGIGFPPEATYSEELLIGYRWYDAKDVKPLYEFGYGLSYSTFEYKQVHFQQLLSNVRGNPHLMKSRSSQQDAPVAEVKVSVKNTADRDGAEIVQLYVEYPKTSREPPKQLRSFLKVDLKAGEEKEVTFTVTERDVAVWNVEHHAWEVSTGLYKLHIGASSRDIRIVKQFTL
eukprot:gene2838-3022_t